jgi:hypothetical protein
MSFLVLIFNVLNFVQITNRFFVQSFTNKKKKKNLPPIIILSMSEKRGTRIKIYHHVDSYVKIFGKKKKKKKRKKTKKLKRNKKRGLPQQLRTQRQDVILLKTRLGQSKVPLMLVSLVLSGSHYLASS